MLGGIYARAPLVTGCQFGGPLYLSLLNIIHYRMVYQLHYNLQYQELLHSDVSHIILTGRGGGLINQ